MVRLRSWLLAIGLGVALAGGVYWLANAPLLAVYVGLFWTVGGVLTAHNASSIPELVALSPDWGTSTRLWSGAFGGLGALAATAMMGLPLAPSTEVSLGLGLFVLGVAITMANVGVGFVNSLETDPSTALE